MKRFALAVLVSCALALPARAQLTWTAYVFTTVDAVLREVGYLTITGVRDGESAAAVHRLPLGPITSSSNPTNPSDIGESCERKALLAMAKPGAYVLRVEVSSYPSSYYTKCTLARAEP